MLLMENKRKRTNPYKPSTHPSLAGPHLLRVERRVAVDGGGEGAGDVGLPHTLGGGGGGGGGAGETVCGVPSCGEEGNAWLELVLTHYIFFHVFVTYTPLLGPGFL